VRCADRRQGLIAKAEEHRGPDALEFPSLAAEHLGAEKIPLDGIGRFVEAAEISEDSDRDIGGHERMDAGHVHAEAVIPPVDMAARVFLIEETAAHGGGKA
jgi:hypothetical protein